MASAAQSFLPACVSSKCNFMMMDVLKFKNTREKIRYVGTGALILFSFVFLVLAVTAILAVVLRID